MADYVSAVNDAMGSADFLRQSGAEFFRDAWLAAEFGRHRQSEFVRLIDEHEQWPDFEARDGNAIERVECVEADIPGRRRGDEYRRSAQHASAGILVEDDPVESWIERAEQVPASLAAAIATKIGKRYATRISLLVYLNIIEFGIRQPEIETAMAASVSRALPHFHRVWILWKARLYGPWSSATRPG